MLDINYSKTIGFLVLICLIGGLATGCGPSARIKPESSYVIQHDPQRILVHASLFEAENNSLNAFNESLRSRLSQCGIGSAFAVSYKVPNIFTSSFRYGRNEMIKKMIMFPHKPGIFYDYEEVAGLKPDTLLRVDARSTEYRTSRETTYIDVRVSKVPSDDPLWTPSSVMFENQTDPVNPTLLWKGEGSLRTGATYMANLQERGDAWAKEVFGSLVTAGILKRCVSQSVAR